MKPYHKKIYTPKEADESWCRKEGVVFYEDEGGNLHSLEGPAVIQGNGLSVYYIHGDILDEEEWEKHPLVVEYKLNRLIKEVLND